MKSNSLRPGFEMIFSAGVIACLVLPPMVFAQEPRQLKIMITNGDTTINGKKMKDLSAAERADALSRMSQFRKRPDGTSSFRLEMKKRGKDSLSATMAEDMVIDDNRPGRPMGRFYRIERDSSGRSMELHADRMPRGGGPGELSLRFMPRDDERGDDRREPQTWGLEMKRREPFMGPNRRNSQNFSYSSTDKDGISTNVNFRASDVDKETLKRISGAEKPELAINDLVITPSFSTGKTNLSFAVAEKGNAEVQLKDSEGKLLWTEKTTGNFYKSFSLPQNGIYYLQVKQNNKVASRRIVKEQ